MIPDGVVNLALYAGGFALILYWCWTAARKNEVAIHKGEGDGR